MLVNCIVTNLDLSTCIIHNTIHDTRLTSAPTAKPNNNHVYL